MGKIRTVASDWMQRWREFRLHCNEDGLTLIELMVVVVILGIIAAVAIPAISGAISSAKANTTESNLATIQEALQRYDLDHNAYPSSLGLLTKETNSGGTAVTSGGFGPYLSVTFPENDAYGNAIEYGTVGTTSVTGYYLWSEGTNTSVTTPPTSAPTSSTDSGAIVAGGGTGVTALSPTQINSSFSTSITSWPSKWTTS